MRWILLQTLVMTMMTTENLVNPPPPQQLLPQMLQSQTLLRMDKRNL
jgi:hypothetical protein